MAHERKASQLITKGREYFSVSPLNFGQPILQKNMRQFFCRHSSKFLFPKLSRLQHSSSSNPSRITSLAQLLQGRIPRSHLLQLHAHIYRLHAHQDNLISTRLIGHYPPNFALRVFNHLQRPNIFPCNAILRVFSENGLFSDALLIYKRVVFASTSPNELTFCFLAKACYGANDVNCVKQIQTHVVKFGFHCNSFVCSSLLNVYAKAYRDLASARLLFDEMPEKNLVHCWTSLISGYAQSGQSDEVFRLFLLMLKENLRPGNDTLVSVLSACSKLDTPALEKWTQVFVEHENAVGSNKELSDSLNIVAVYLYGKLGCTDQSRDRFDRLSENGRRSVISWNAMINAYVQNGSAVDGLCLFQQMISEDAFCRPNHVTMVYLLSACAQIGDLDLGIWVHEYMKSEGYTGILNSNKNLATSLIDMYAKCGALDRGREVFEQLASKDVVSYNAMIMGLAINGEGEEALQLFSEMEKHGLRPNANTLLNVLCCCCHSGLLEVGREVFTNMSRRYSVILGLEHYACYIDLLARAGCIEEALVVVNSLPFEPNNFVLGALLNGCLIHNNLGLAQKISTMLVKVDPDNSGGYVMFSNALAVDHNWGDISGLRRSMRESGIIKQPGSSWVSIKGLVHQFLVGSASHPESHSIYSALGLLLKEMKSSTSQELNYLD